MAEATQQKIDADTAALHAFIGAMDRFMVAYGQDTGYVSQAPEAISEEAFKRNSALFIKTLKTQINDLNEGPKTASAFRDAWNTASPDPEDLKAQGQDLLKINGTINADTLTVLKRIAGLNNYFNLQTIKSAPHQEALHQAAQATLAYATHFKLVDPSHNPDAKKDATQDAKGTPPPPKHSSAPTKQEGFVYDAAIDSAIAPAMRARIAVMQSAMGLDPSGHLDEATQKKLHDLLHLQGQLSALNNAQCLGALDEQLNALIEEKREEQKDALRQEQRNKLAPYNLALEGVMQALENATDVDDAKRKLYPLMEQNPALKAKPDEKDRLFNDLWMLEFEKRQWNSANILDKISPSARGQFAVYDVMSHIYKGTQANSLVSKADPQRQESAVHDDWFFDKEVYEHLRQGKQIDGLFVGQTPGTVFERADIAQMACDTLFKRLNEAGIDNQDFSKALLEGRFTLSAQDLKLVNESFGRPAFQDVLNDGHGRSILAMNLQSHLMHVGEFKGAHGTYQDAYDFIYRARSNGDQDALDALEHAYNQAKDFVLSPIIDNYRAQQFNKTFGSFADLHDVTTLRHTALDSDETQEVKSSAAALTLMTIARHGLKRFEKDYGMSAEDAKAALEAAPSLDKAAIPAELRKDITAEMKRFSVVSYFDIGRGDARQNAYSPHQDFQALRDRYTVEHQPEVDPNAELNEGYDSKPRAPASAKP